MSENSNLTSPPKRVRLVSPSIGDKFCRVLAEENKNHKEITADKRTIKYINGTKDDEGVMGKKTIYCVETIEDPNCEYEIAYEALKNRWREWDGEF